MMDAQAAFALMYARQSIGLLTTPAPDTAQLQMAIAAGLTAPDHHRLRPWRFITVEGDARERMGEVFEAALAATGERDAAQLLRVRQQPLRAPLILVCVTTLQEHPKVPFYEQTLSMGAAIQNILLMLQAQGFCAMWRTGALVESAVVKQAFGLAQRDQIAGLIYIGSAARDYPAREPLSVHDFLSNWQGESAIDEQ